MIYTCIPQLCIVRLSTYYVMTVMDRSNIGTLNEIRANGGPFFDVERLPRQKGFPTVR